MWIPARRGVDALGNKDVAQELRLDAFHRWLSPAHVALFAGWRIRGYRLAEERAMAHALAHPDTAPGTDLPRRLANLDAANRLVRAHPEDGDGRDYGRLRPAAEALAGKFPAAATLLHRALAEDVLRRAPRVQYAYAARDVRACAALASLLPDEEGLESHATFLARLKRQHPRKIGFWSVLAPMLPR